MTSEGWTIGQKVKNDRYKIEKELGSGGFATTYKATDIADNNSFVVIKKPHCTARHRSACIENEKLKLIEISNKPSSPKNIAKIKDSFEEDGLLCLVTSYIAGASLDSIISEEESLGFSFMLEVLVWIKDVGRSLAWLHKNGLVHLDVSPSNIIITPKREAFLIDFGSVRTIGDVTSSVPCNKSYAPWELNETYSKQPINPASDIYSLAATLYKGVTGTAPASSSVRFMEIKRGKDDVILDSPVELNSKVTKSLSQAILSGLEIDIHSRSKTMQTWLRSLDGPFFTLIWLEAKTKLYTLLKRLYSQISYIYNQLPDIWNRLTTKAFSICKMLEDLLTDASNQLRKYTRYFLTLGILVVFSSSFLLGFTNGSGESLSFDVFSATTWMDKLEFALPGVIVQKLCIDLAVVCFSPVVAYGISQAIDESWGSFPTNWKNWLSIQWGDNSFHKNFFDENSLRNFSYESASAQLEPITILAISSASIAIAGVVFENISGIEAISSLFLLLLLPIQCIAHTFDPGIACPVDAQEYLRSNKLKQQSSFKHIIAYAWGYILGSRSEKNDYKRQQLAEQYSTNSMDDAVSDEMYNNPLIYAGTLIAVDIILFYSVSGYQYTNIDPFLFKYLIILIWSSFGISVQLAKYMTLGKTILLLVSIVSIWMTFGYLSRFLLV